MICGLIISGGRPMTEGWIRLFCVVGVLSIYAFVAYRLMTVRDPPDCPLLVAIPITTVIVIVLGFAIVVVKWVIDGFLSGT
jgi:CHASE2 domain-containing sensor protein